MKAFNGFLSGGSRFKSVERVRLAISSGGVAIPDEGNGSRRVAEASLEESAAHDLVRYHQSCQGLTERHISLNNTSDSQTTHRLVDGEGETASDRLVHGKGREN